MALTMRRIPDRATFIRSRCDRDCLQMHEVWLSLAGMLVAPSLHSHTNAVWESVRFSFQFRVAKAPKPPPGKFALFGGEITSRIGI